MIILIDGSLITKPRGIGRYVEELLRALASVSLEGLSFIVLIPMDYKLPDSLNHKNIIYHRVKSYPFPIWEQIILPFYIKKFKVDLVHFPYNTYSLFSILMSVKKIITIHDLIFLTSHGGTIYQRVGNIYRSVLIRLLKFFIKKVTVITDSQFSKEQIDLTLGCDSKVVYISIGDADKKSFDALHRFGLDELSYFIHIGGVSPHKNTQRVIDAFLDANIANKKLVIVGVPPNSELALHNKNDNILYPGWLSNEEIRGLISKSICMIFPSLAEGYGMPIVESLVQKKPVITSAVAPLNELIINSLNEKSCLLINPTCSHEIKNAIINLHNEIISNEIVIEQSLFYPKSMGCKMESIYHNTLS